MKTFRLTLRCLGIAVLLTYCERLVAQETMEDYVKQNAVPVATIDPGVTDFTDLNSLGHAIADAKIVMLGEQDHGDALTFSAKSRIIKYLHEKLGFNVLAFESDFFSLNEGWDKLEKRKETIIPFLKNNITHLWTDCQNCSELLFNYIPASFETTHPLQVAGFDNQMFLTYSLLHLSAAIDSLITKSNLEIGKSPGYRIAILPLFDTLIKKLWLKAYRNEDIPDSQFSNCDQYLRVLKQQTTEKLGPGHFWSMVIENLLVQNRMLSEFKSPNTLNGTRDAQMALNIQWLAKIKYPNQKIIVWAANTHVCRNEDGFKSMGYVLGNGLIEKEKTYILAFTSYSGMGGRLGNPTYIIKPAASNSIESWLKGKYKYAFVDYKKYNTRWPDEHAKFYQRSHVYTSFKREWTRIYDGLLFISEMQRCQPVVTLPPTEKR